jgi:glycerol kinase
MNKDSGIELTVLRVDGGAANNNFLMQFQADLLGVPVDRPEVVESTAVGSAYLAGLAVGFWDSPDELLEIRNTERMFEPAMSASMRDELYAGWLAAVAQISTNK